MASPPLSKCFASPKTQEEKESNRTMYQHYREKVLNLPSVDGCATLKLHKYNGWFAPMTVLLGTMVAQKLFQANPSDIILATIPKSGTTWLKSILFAVVHRNSLHYEPKKYLTTVPVHECVPFLEHHVYTNDQVPDLDLLPSPRLFSTHIPIHLLPHSVTQSGCKLVYLCREPKDNFISLWHYTNARRSNMGAEVLPLDRALDLFCNGASLAGPFWDHVLGYWNASLERPEQVLFLKYEDVMKDPTAALKRIADFVGRPFTGEEEKDGAAESILALCKFENLRSLEVKKRGPTRIPGLENSHLFRRGTVGDSLNYLTTEMARRFDKITKDKFRDTGLNF